MYYNNCNSGYKIINGKSYLNKQIQHCGNVALSLLQLAQDRCKLTNKLLCQTPQPTPFNLIGLLNWSIFTYLSNFDRGFEFHSIRLNKVLSLLFSPTFQGLTFSQYFSLSALRNIAVKFEMNLRCLLTYTEYLEHIKFLSLLKTVQAGTILGKPGNGNLIEVHIKRSLSEQRFLETFNWQEDQGTTYF